VLLRIVLTLVAARLIQVPFLKLGGGLLILWFAFRLLLDNQETHSKDRRVNTLLHAVWIITVADLTMSLENVLGVAGAAKGSTLLLWLGLGLSIPLVMFASDALSRLMERFPFIVVLGAAILGYVGGEMVADDSAVQRRVTGIPHLELLCQIAGAAFIFAIAAWIKLRRSKASVSSLR